MSKKRRIIFRADGNSQIGLGHVVRSLALADMLRDTFECVFAIQAPAKELQEQIRQTCDGIIVLPLCAVTEERFTHELDAYISEEEIVVLDGYDFNTSYQKSIKAKRSRLVCIDDIHAYPFVADVIINHSGSAIPEDYDVPEGTKLCLGLSYALVRSPFLNGCSENTSLKPGTVFICLGGSDPYNLTKALLKSTLAATGVKHITVIVGGAYQHHASLTPYATDPGITIGKNLNAEEMCHAMQEAHVVICSASSIAIEALHVIKGSLLTGYYVENQKEFSCFMKETGISVDLGNLMTANEHEISNIISQQFLGESIDSMPLRRQQLHLGNQKKIYNTIFKNL